MRGGLLVLFCIVLLAACATGAERPDPSADSDLLAVFTADDAHYLASPPEGDAPNVVCLDPPPMRFRVHVEEAVFGHDGARRFEAVTVDHFGSESLLFMPGMRKLGLFMRSDDGVVRLPRHAWMTVWRDATGEWLTPAPLWFLPCQVNDLIEPIRVQSLDATSYGDACGVYRGPETGPDKAADMPCRSGFIEAIRMTRLRERLLALRPSGEQWRCALGEATGPD